ncbi:DUF6049 family protein [Flexivirga sp. B27]
MSDASSRQPGSTWSLHNGGRTAAALLAFVLAFASLSLTLGAPSATAAASSTVRVSLNANAPAVSASGEAVSVSGTITNTGSAIAHPVVHVSVSSRLLDTRSTAESWMSGKLDLPMTEVASAEASPLSSGSSTSFAVDIPGKSLKYDYGMASLPLTVTVTDGKSSTASGIRGMARSTLHLQNGPVRSPLQMSIVIPLTLPADTDLFGPSGTARAEAWEHAIGPDSQVQRTLDAFQGQPVTFAVDPALIDPPAAADNNVPSASASPSSSSSGSGSGSGSGTESSGSAPSDSAGTSNSTSGGDHSSDPGSDTATPNPTSTAAGTSGTTDDTDSSDDSSDSNSDNTGGATDGATDQDSQSPSPSESSTTQPTTSQGRIDAAVDDLTDRLTSLGDEQAVWWLPDDDPDLSALQRAGAPGKALARRDFARPLPDAVKDLGDTRLVWPSADLSASSITTWAKSLAARSKGDAVALLPGRSVGQSQTSTTTHRVSGTSGVITYDESLSRIFSKSTTSPGTETSRLLTQLMALYLQSPGTARSLTLVAPRSGGANPVQLAAQVGALTEADWVSLRSGRQTAEALRTAPKTSLLSQPRKGTPFPKPPARAITPAELADLSRSRSRLSALQSALVGGDDVIPQRKRGLDIVGSTRWRGAPAKLAEVADRDTDAVSSMLRKLSIRSSTINFFADSGDISVTVSNELNRPVRDLQLHLLPRTFLIRVTDDVQQVDIDAESRATAHFHIEAVGGGTVPLDAMLIAPNGTPLTDKDAPSQVKINVHPTSGWIMWVLGVLAGLILLIGLLRAVRRGPRTATEPVAADTPTPNDAIVDAGQRRPQNDDQHDDDHDNEHDNNEHNDEGTDTDDD